LTDVIAEIGALTDQIAATSHVGRSNRLLRRRERLFEAIDAHADRLDLLRQLLDHAQPSRRRSEPTYPRGHIRVRLSARYETCRECA